MKIGVVGDCLRGNIEEVIRQAAALELSGIQLYAVKGEFCPQNLTEADILRFKSNIHRLLQDSGI